MISIERAFGSDFNDSLTGDAGNNILYGNDGSDYLDGGGASDFLHGGDGADVFGFGVNSGNDRIGDFEDGTDIIDLSAVTGLDDFSQLLIANNAQGDAVISFGDNSIELDGVDASLVDATDFVF